MKEKLEFRLENSKNHEQVSCKEVVAIALCGGFGTRLKNITEEKIPKSLVQVNNKPLLDYSIDPLLKSGVDRFVFATGYKGEQIEDYVLAQGYSNHVFFSQDYPPPGITVSLKNALNRFDVENPIVVFDTDAVRIGLDFRDAYNFHKFNNATTTLVCTYTQRPQNSNFVVINDKFPDAGVILLEPEENSIKNPIIKCGMMICSSKATSFLRKYENIPNSWIGIVECLSMVDEIKTYVTQKPLIYSNVNTPEDLLEIENRIINAY